MGNRSAQDHFSKVSIHNFSGLKKYKKRVYRNCGKNLPWEASWAGLFPTTSVGSRAKNFNIVSNHHGRTHKWNLSILKPEFNGNVHFLSVSDPNSSFWANLVQKMKVVRLSRNLLPTLIRIGRMQWWYSIKFCFQTEFPFSGKFGPKNQNWQFKLKFVILTNSNMQNSLVVFTFSVLDRKHCFWENLVQKIKIVSLSLNFVSRLIRICRTQRSCSPFLWYTGNTPFGQIWSNKLKLSV